MGTNYYAARDTCPQCGHTDEVLHIGKSSAGWTFSFQAYREHETEGWHDGPIESWADWQKVLARPDVHLHNEYEEPVTLDELRALVESKQTEKRNHTTYMRTEYRQEAGLPASIVDDFIADNFYGPEGHSFQWGEFS